MITETQQAALRHADCEVRFDDLTRQLYATDASHYRIEPAAVAFPRSSAQVSSVIRAAAEHGLPITPRGAGSGLVGGALGEGVVIDFARYHQLITELDRDQRTVRVGAGVVLDNLNIFLRPHGFWFGPDVATSSRATIGGMIANNSSGARTRLYGTTADHVESVECVLADGRIVESAGAARELALVRQVTEQHAAEIRSRMPAGLAKRWPGYGLDRCLREPTLPNVLSGSEGTLAGITSAVLHIVPLPKEKGLGLVFFSSVAEAMQATVELLELEPAAIEHVDDVLTDQTKGQRQFQAARDLLELDARPCKSILIVEFFDHVTEKLAELERRRLGLRTRIVTSPAEMSLVWSVRQAGLALLTGRKGRAKPVTCIEDTAVLAKDLPAYVSALQSMLSRIGVEACFYGHAASGLLHIRPVIDLHTDTGLRQFRQVSDEVAALVRQFKGSLAAEHGVGIARTEYLRDQIGPSLLEAMRGIKSIFDPRNVLNPGKVIDDGRYRLDTRLRSEVKVEVPFPGRLAFAAKDESFLGNLEQCNGCGGCRKPAPTMCPTFVVTGDEALSTRGRANIIRASLEGRFPDPLSSRELERVLGECLSCKACATECPSNVNLPLLKAELLHARHRRDGLSLHERILSRVDLIGAAGTLAPGLSNAMLQSPLVRSGLERLFGFTRERPLPLFAEERFDRWFDSRVRPESGRRGRVLLWDDCFVRHNEPQIGRAAVRVLEAAGFEVNLLRGRRCCGRPAFSQGNLDEAARCGTHNVELLAAEKKARGFEAIVFLEPSCYSMFAEDYRELGINGEREFAKRSVLFENFVSQLLQEDSKALTFSFGGSPVAIHAHCHAKALTNVNSGLELAKRLQGRSAMMLNTGCCGMAGAFGAMADKYELTIKVAQPLVQQIQAQPKNTVIVASGTSCRQQISHAAGIQARHMAEVLAEALEGGSEGGGQR